MFYVHLSLVDLRRLCDAQQEMQGHISLAKLPGSCSYMQSDAGAAWVWLKFQRSHDSHLVITGQINADGLQMVCQRCLNLVTLPLKTTVNLIVLGPQQQIDQLSVEYDPWVISGKRMKLIELIDHELMLNLPIIAVHPNCEIQTKYGDRKQQIDSNANPFGRLAQLLPKN